MALVVKILPAEARRLKRCGFHSWAGKIPWKRAWQPTPVFLPGESHGQRSVEGYSAWGPTESDTTEATWHTHTRSLCGLFRHREPFTVGSEVPTLRSLVEPGQAGAP